MVKFTMCFAAAFIFYSCGSKVSTPAECVDIFINAAYEHDMSKAWGILGPEAIAYYNDIGEKNRKSGKGILEHDISEIIKFRSKGKDYSIVNDSTSKNMVKIRDTGGNEFDIYTIEIDGGFMIKDYSSVNNIIKAIAMEQINKDYY